MSVVGPNGNTKRAKKHGATRPSYSYSAALRNKFLPADGQVQNTQHSRIYVFGDGDDDAVEDELNKEDSHDQFEMSELRPRIVGGKAQHNANSCKHKNAKTEPMFIEREIQGGDTLQIFSLQYGCPLSELKRYNKLVNDQDFFALRRIRIPIRQHGLLTEDAEEKRRRPNPEAKSAATTNQLVNGNGLCNSDDRDDDDTEYDEDVQFVRQISIRDSMRDKTSARQFLQNMDRDLEKIRLATNSQKESLEEVKSILMETRIHPLLLPHYQRKKKQSYCDGATCGLTWQILVVVLILLTLVVPVLFYIYWHFLR